MISTKIKTVFFAMILAMGAIGTLAQAQEQADEAMFTEAGWRRGHGGGWGPGHGGGWRPGHPGRPGFPGHPGRPGPGWPGHPGHPGHGGGWGPQWMGAGTACGPYQPWGTSLQCPTMNPQGMSCRGMQRGTKCFASSYWQPNFICTNPYNGQNQYGSYIFQMYVCN